MSIVSESSLLNWICYSRAAQLIEFLIAITIMDAMIT